MELHTLNPSPPHPEHEHAEIVRTTARQLWSAEEAIDAALRETSLLIVQVIDGRSQVKLAACAVQRALEPVAAGQATLFESRANLLKAHSALRELQDDIGAAAVKLGGLNKPDHDSPREDAEWGWPFGSMRNVVPLPAGAG